MHKNSTVLLIAIIKVLLVASIFGVENNELQWPDSPRPGFSIKSDSEFVDGILSEWFVLESNSIKLSWIPQAPWVQQRQKDSRASLSFYDTRIPDLKMQLILYPPKSWLGDLDATSIEAYVASLEQQFPKSEIELINPDSYIPPVGSVPFLGGPFRQVYFTVSPQEEGAAPFTVYDYMTVKEGNFFVIRYTAPANVLVRMESQLIRGLFYFNTL